MNPTIVFAIVAMLFIVCCIYSFLSLASSPEETHHLLISVICFTDPERTSHERYNSTAQDMMPNRDQIPFQAKPLQIPPPVHLQRSSIRQALLPLPYDTTDTLSMLTNMSHDLAFDLTQVPSRSTGSQDFGKTA
jgi:hypothetical protein